MINGFKRSSERIYKSADTLAVTTRSFGELLAKATGRKSEEIHHLPNWAEDTYLNPPKDDFRFNNESFNIVFAGNIGESQGLDLVLKAALETSKSNIQWHLFGGGRYENKLRQEAKSLNLSNLIFHGRVSVENLPSIYKAANVLLLTLTPNQGYSTTMPGKFAGYLTSGTPILTNIEGEVKEIVEEYSMGFYFNGESLQDLLRSVEKIKQLSDLELEKIAENTKGYYETNFAKNSVLSNLESLLSYLI